MAKLLIAVVHSDDAGPLIDALRGADFRVTQVPSRGGFLGARNVMIFAGVEDDQVDLAMRLIDENCQSRTQSVPLEMLGGMDTNWLPAEVTHGGATVFVVPLDEIRRI
ncbi:MAG: cyclic-di-AMP receptor [Chloroflexota bacterium]|nr:cyclic-di-AMP receptor [Chloroflexota bacterium]